MIFGWKLVRILPLKKNEKKMCCFSYEETVVKETIQIIFTI